MAKKIKEEVNEVQGDKTQIYCGPSLPGLPQFTILVGIPKHIAMHMEECSQIKKMVVDISELNRVRLKLSVKGSYEQKLYMDISNYLKGARR